MAVSSQNGGFSSQPCLMTPKGIIQIYPNISLYCMPIICPILDAYIPIKHHQLNQAPQTADLLTLAGFDGANIPIASISRRPPLPFRWDKGTWAVAKHSLGDTWDCSAIQSFGAFGCVWKSGIAPKWKCSWGSSVVFLQTFRQNTIYHSRMNQSNPQVLYSFLLVIHGYTVNGRNPAPVDS